MLLEILAIMLTFSAVWGMVRYAPTRPDALLRHRVRADIVGLLTRQPGSSITDICREGKIAWGTAQHHLYLLQRTGLVTSMPMGRSRAFFPAGLDAKNSQVLALLRNQRVRELTLAIFESPDILQKELCGRLGLTRKVFRHHINGLIRAGLVIELRGPRARRYRPTDVLRDGGPKLLNGNSDHPVPSPRDGHVLAPPLAPF